MEKYFKGAFILLFSASWFVSGIPVWGGYGLPLWACILLSILSTSFTWMFLAWIFAPEEKDEPELTTP